MYWNIRLKNIKSLRLNHKIYDEIKNELDKVGLKHNETLDKYPHQLSGGQR